MGDQPMKNEDSTFNSEQTISESYAETSNPEVEAVVQFYERKIGIFENTLDLFKQNLLVVNNRFNTLRLAYRPLKEANEKLTEEYDVMFEVNHSMTLELKLKSTTIELEKNRNNELESQIKNYEKTFEKYNSIFSYLEMNVLELLKDVASDSPQKKWKLVLMRDYLKGISVESIPNENESESVVNTNVENHETNTVIEQELNLDITSINLDSLEIQYITELDFDDDLNSDTENAKNEIDNKQSTPVSSPISNQLRRKPSFQHKESKPNSLDIIFEEKPTMLSVMNEDLLELDDTAKYRSSLTVNESAIFSICQAAFGSPNVKILPVYTDLEEYQNENGSFIFIPDNDYFRVRSYVCSDDFNWEEDNHYVKCPRYQKKLNKRESTIIDSPIDSFVLSFNSIVYERVHDIPPKQPIDGVYILVNEPEDDHDNESTSSAIENKTYTYQEIINSENVHCGYKFVPNLQYSYLNGMVTIPNFFKNLIQTNDFKKDYSFNSGDDIWPLRKVVYGNYQNVPPIQPINGYYVFVYNKNFAKRANERINKASNRRSMKIALNESNQDINVPPHMLATVPIPTDNDNIEHALTNQSLNTILGQINNSEENKKVLAVLQHEYDETDENNRDKTYSSLKKISEASVDKKSNLRKNDKAKKRGTTLRKHKSLINPFIQLNVSGETKEAESTNPSRDSQVSNHDSEISITEKTAPLQERISKKNKRKSSRKK